MNQEPIIIELDARLEYKNGKVYIKKMETNEIPAELTFGIMKALNNTLLEYYKFKETKNDTE